jgi:hypothetical protein
MLSMRQELRFLNTCYMKFMLQRVKHQSIKCKGLKQSSSGTAVNVFTFDDNPMHVATMAILTTYMTYIIHVTSP